MANERVLIVDDEPQIRRALQTALAGHGYDVVVAADGDTAMTLIGAHPPDAIVLDLVMPGMDGFAVLREVRTWSEVPVIVLTPEGRIPLPHRRNRRVLTYPASLDDIFRALQQLGVADEAIPIPMRASARAR